MGHGTIGINKKVPYCVVTSKTDQIQPRWQSTLHLCQIYSIHSLSIHFGMLLCVSIFAQLCLETHTIWISPLQFDPLHESVRTRSLRSCSVCVCGYYLFSPSWTLSVWVLVQISRYQQMSFSGEWCISQSILMTCCLRHSEQQSSVHTNNSPVCTARTRRVKHLYRQATQCTVHLCGLQQ